MVSKKTRGRPPKNAIHRQEEEETQNEGKDDGISGYEQSRKQRIQENMQRMEKMGILNLSLKLKSEFLSSKKQNPSQMTKKPSALPPSSPRRSSRLKTLTPVSYVEVFRAFKKEGKSLEDVKINIEEGSKPEIYTEEDEQLLGDCKETWTLLVDGYEDGHRVYDQYEGKSCHQCRQKTLGHHTDCSKCKVVQGQFCGDCLFMRYGENILEANENPSWICPVCRGICNCSRCRREKGWAPTGSIYRKVQKLGFKSVAHYLIHTRSSKKDQEGQTAETPLSDKGSVSLTAGDSELSNGISKPQSDYNNVEGMEENVDASPDADYDVNDELSQEDNGNTNN